MMRSMTRVAVAGCMALVALGAVAVLGSATAEAAPSVSPFGGTYAWGSMPVTISDGGRISSPWSNPDISGRVSADGNYSFTVSETFIYYDEPSDQYRRHTSRSTYTGNMASDADGNIVGTRDGGNGDSFFWLRH
jgi:hypothetical protein